VTPISSTHDETEKEVFSRLSMKEGGMLAIQRASHSDHIVLHVSCRPTTDEQGNHTKEY